jgi:hypothetical protein
VDWAGRSGGGKERRRVGNGNGDEEKSAEDKDREHVMKDRVRMKYSCGHAGMGTRQT